MAGSINEPAITPGLPDGAPCYVHTGNAILCTEEDAQQAVLSSNIAVTLWHPAKRGSVVSYVQLSKRRYAFTDRGRQIDARYASDALQQMFEHLALTGVSPSSCVCKIFGGARVFAGSGQGVGNANVRELKRLLDRSGVGVSSESIEGAGHRVVRFVVRTGDVWVSHRQRQLIAARPECDEEDGRRPRHEPPTNRTRLPLFR